MGYLALAASRSGAASAQGHRREHIRPPYRSPGRPDRRQADERLGGWKRRAGHGLPAGAVMDRRPFRLRGAAGAREGIAHAPAGAAPRPSRRRDCIPRDPHRSADPAILGPGTAPVDRGDGTLARGCGSRSGETRRVRHRARRRSDRDDRRAAMALGHLYPPRCRRRQRLWRRGAGGIRRPCLCERRARPVRRHRHAQRSEPGDGAQMRLRRDWARFAHHETGETIEAVWLRLDKPRYRWPSLRRTAAPDRVAA